ncbi:MAG TPA: hypothetical protein VE862_09895 [Candidatus Acidoferrum sp.]|nr:hypothetical protein [Candidatus Acidoferrum sp.]
MPHITGILALFQLIRLIFGAAIVVAVIWLLIKVGKLTGAYTEKLKSQNK